jgi:hypothetical protein
MITLGELYNLVNQYWVVHHFIWSATHNQQHISIQNWVIVVVPAYHAYHEVMMTKGDHDYP